MLSMYHEVMENQIDMYTKAYFHVGKRRGVGKKKSKLEMFSTSGNTVWSAFAPGGYLATFHSLDV